MKSVIAEMLREKMGRDHLSARQTAKLTSISHGTIDRILAGEQLDIDTLVKLCAWLEVSPASALGDLGEGKDALASSIAAVIEAEPTLAETFFNAISDVKNGKLLPGDIRDIVAYAAYRITQRKNDRSTNSLSEGSGRED